jgi:hypothetical protein
MPNPKELSENEKDWDNPIFVSIYAALATAGTLNDQEGQVCSWLNNNGFCNLTCCPMCHVDDFTHVEGCKLGNLLDKMQQKLRECRLVLWPWLANQNSEITLEAYIKKEKQTLS